jgi:uncharacterized membrane protein YfcA
MITDWQFYAFAAPAVILVGLGKGGFSGLGLLSFPLMALVAPPIQAAAIILPILMLQGLIGVWAFRREYSRENLKMLIPGALVGLFVGYLFARTVPDAAILLLVGVISTLFVIFTFVGARRGQVDPPTPNGWSATLWGGDQRVHQLHRQRGRAAAAGLSPATEIVAKALRWHGDDVFHRRELPEVSRLYPAGRDDEAEHAHVRGAVPAGGGCSAVGHMACAARIGRALL